MWWGRVLGWSVRRVDCLAWRFDFPFSLFRFQGSTGIGFCDFSPRPALGLVGAGGGFLIFWRWGSSRWSLGLVLGDAYRRRLLLLLPPRLSIVVRLCKFDFLLFRYQNHICIYVAIWFLTFFFIQKWYLHFILNEAFAISVLLREFHLISYLNAFL